MTANPLTIALAARAGAAVHKLLEGRDPEAAWTTDDAVELALRGWLDGALTVTEKVDEMVQARLREMVVLRAAPVPTVELDIPHSAEERIALADLDIANVHGVAMNTARPPIVAMLIPPSRHTQMTPEQAIVLAAWLVALADPFSSVKFVHVLHKVHNT